MFVTVDVTFHENDMYFAHFESALQGENQTKVQTLDYTILDVNHLGLSGDVLETSGDDSQKHNDVNHLDLSGDVLETSVIIHMKTMLMNRHHQKIHCLYHHWTTYCQPHHHWTTHYRQLPHSRSHHP
ncbi:hypothetical protein ACFXTH_009896 [Malus domestica]